MMKRLPLMLCALLLAGHVARAADDGLLLHWNFDEGKGTAAQDAASQIDATFSGAWNTSPSGSAAVLDGTAATVVKTQLPPAKRLDKNSWTMMLWIKPQQFTIDKAQNQRRLFAYGSFPQAYFGLDILANGTPTFYETYQAGGKSPSFGLAASTPLALHQWAHLAVVSDHDAKTTRLYLNGRLRGEAKWPPDFDPDLSQFGELTVGNGFQNFWGEVDEVQLFRRALSRQEIAGEFEHLKTAFGVIATPAEVQADAREAMEGAFLQVNAAWAKADFARVRQLLRPLIANMDVSAQFRSYAQLRLAQSEVASKQTAAARATYAQIAANKSYPQTHRDEAAERVRELDRVAKGLLPRDPNASHVVAPPLPKARHQIFVSPNGKDSNTGTQNQPLATLKAARDAARKILADGKGGVEIVLAPGEYQVTQTLELGAQDSGTANAPVVYRAQQANSVTLYGGTRLTGFAPVKDAKVLARLPQESRSQVLALDLKARGITDYGALAVRGFGQPPSPPTVELYVDDKPMTLARWPNAGFVKAAKLIEAGDQNANRPSVLGYDDSRPSRWTEAKDAWLFGYFHFLWADATAKIGAIDTQNKTITTAQAYQYGDGGMSSEQGIVYYVFNLLEEIDQPGEWYLDRDTGILYLYPPSDLKKATVELSLFSGPMLHADNLNNARFEGISFDLGRADGIVLNDSSHCLFVGCKVQRMAGNGISVLGGAHDTLLSCDIGTIGRRATEIVGGDRETLTPAGHVVANCRIHNFGRIDRTYTPGVQLEGVGNHVTHNLFTDCPSSVMRIEGNDHVIEYNEVRDAVLESDDQGAMELFANPTYRGVVFRYNRFTRIGIPPGRAAVHGQAGIRFDDAISGMLVYGNIFDRAAGGNFGGVQMNSGRDNIIDNNLFLNCKQGVSGGYNSQNSVWKGLRAGEKRPGVFTNDLYLKRYPKIATMLDQGAQNFAWRNVFVNCERDFSGNLSALDLLANANFATEPNAKTLESIGFRPIPTNEIGLYADAWRAKP